MKKPVLFILTILAIATLSAVAHPPPEKDKMTLAEFKKRSFEFDGKIVEIELTGASNIEQIGPGKYSVYCSFYSSQDHESAYETIYFLKDEDGDALEFFEKLDQNSSSINRMSVYILVEGSKRTALGEKYRRSKGTYSW